MGTDMISRIFFTLLIFSIGVAHGQSASSSLRILPNGEFKLDGNPALNLNQLKLQLRRMAQEQPAPIIDLYLKHGDNPAGVDALLRLFGTGEYGPVRIIISSPLPAETPSPQPPALPGGPTPPKSPR
jgi:hypothetical protein